MCRRSCCRTQGVSHKDGGRTDVSAARQPDESASSAGRHLIFGWRRPASVVTGWMLWKSVRSEVRATCSPKMQERAHQPIALSLSQLLCEKLVSRRQDRSGCTTLKTAEGPLQLRVCPCGETKVRTTSRSTIKFTPDNCYFRTTRNIPTREQKPQRQAQQKPRRAMRHQMVLRGNRQ